MIPAHLLEGVRQSPDVPESRCGVVDWLLEYGDEGAWQSYLDAFPAHHDVRGRFGAWLCERGDKRGEGYRALGQLRKFPHQTFGEKFIWWNQGQYDYDSYSFLPEDWFTRGVGPAAYFFTRFDFRPECEDTAALAFSKLPKKRRAQLLTEPVPA